MHGVPKRKARNESGPFLFGSAGLALASAATAAGTAAATTATTAIRVATGTTR
jgi:hypothetical protein